MSRLKYKITIGTSSTTYWATDVSDDFIQGEPRNAMGQVPTAIINLSNLDGKYTSGSSPTIEENFGCVVSASKDGGSNYVRLFKGEIWKKNSILTSDGVSTLELNCRDSRLLDKWISCNNAVQKGRDLEDVFIGTSVASNGSSWGA
jgi:hypothetical protein